MIAIRSKFFLLFYFRFSEIRLQSNYVGKIFKSRIEVLDDRVAEMLHMLVHDDSVPSAQRSVECQLEGNTVNRPVVV